MPLLWPVGYVLGLLMGSDTGLRTERVFDSGLRSVQGVAFLLSPPPGSVWLCDVNTHQSAGEVATLDLPTVNWSQMKKLSTRSYNLSCSSTQGIKRFETGE